MRHSSHHSIFDNIKKIPGNASLLAMWVIAALMIPNIVLCLTEPEPLLSGLSSFFLPLGVYSLIMAGVKRTGTGVFVVFPLIFFAAFQVVLLYLYGEGVIAVDMFLNVFTTSVSEATELLSNLVMAIVAVTLLYVTSIVWGAYALKTNIRLSARMARRFLFCGIVWCAIGAVCVGAGYFFIPGFSAVRSIFPANAVANLVEACRRAGQMENYHQTSGAFSYDAKSMADPNERELYIFVVGETGRAHNWSLGGYPRNTNPRLSEIKGLTYFPKSFSESNTTHKSVPMLISSASAENFDSIYNYKSVITAFNEAGYHTAFFSTQTPNRSYTQFFAEEADTTVYLSGGEFTAAHDGDLLPLLSHEIEKNHTKQFIVLHTYGSHFRYSDRYPEDFAHFTPDNCVDASASNRPILINAYDNTILYTDYVLSEIITAAAKAGCKAAVVYSTDHGEDIFDDSRERFLHASPTPTAMQLHVPVLCWLSDECIAQSPDYIINLRRNSRNCVSPQKSLCMTLFDIALIDSPFMRLEWSLVNAGYSEPRPVYLTDRNEPLPWSRVNFKSDDYKYLKTVLGDEKFDKLEINRCGK